MRVEVIEDNDGFKSVRTREPVAAGDLVMLLNVTDVRTSPTRTSIRIGPRRHVEDEVGACVNHSCNPTCAVMGEHIVALVDMPAGTEVTFDYADNEEATLASPFTCLDCGAWVKGGPAPCRSA